MKNAVPNWLFPEGASAEVLAELEGEVGALPTSYLDTLRQGNGGEVGLTVDPFTLCLDPAEAALNYWRSGTYTISGVFVFGGNGGGSLLAFEMNTPGEWPVVSFDPVDPEGSIAEIAPDFESLLGLVGERDA